VLGESLAPEPPVGELGEPVEPEEVGEVDDVDAPPPMELELAELAEPMPLVLDVVPPP
jgi:hypothetical protein